MTKVVVVGSINMDLVVHTQQFPRMGETLFGEQFATHPGGKGANQAVAAQRLGASVAMVGCVGNDEFGQTLTAGLAAEGIDTRWLKTSPDTATGVALITLCQGDNAIVVVPGANMQLSPSDISAAEAAFIDADIILSQLEIPLDTVLAAAKLAQKHSKPFFLNPAPAQALPAELLALCTLLTPNEFELLEALGESEADWKTVLAKHRAVMTKGSDGAWFNQGGQLQHQAGFKVDLVDSTGAGDTFNGALATFWHLGIAEATQRASAAGALSVTRAGAQGGMPTLAELEQFLKTQS
ncbi:ribokinase [Iodobacter fluviatilis]|uniref:Ribokinase n=1 Tax=Iodobacter fluviatilis TaxID=537 RepID=A0A377Q4E4_9NEIS|nr:ribokinase [Iodobacter fluviatilis]TCU90598.1 ribokinase [Iodobacter fluviatilis]STQ89625.1 Ribokinase [Iodobacter fluviatilis]